MSRGDMPYYWKKKLQVGWEACPVKLVFLTKSVIRKNIGELTE